MKRLAAERMFSTYCETTPGINCSPESAFTDVSKYEINLLPPVSGRGNSYTHQDVDGWGVYAWAYPTRVRYVLAVAASILEAPTEYRPGTAEWAKSVQHLLADASPEDSKWLWYTGMSSLSARERMLQEIMSCSNKQSCSEILDLLRLCSDAQPRTFLLYNASDILLVAQGLEDEQATPKNVTLLLEAYSAARLGTDTRQGGVNVSL